MSRAWTTPETQPFVSPWRSATVLNVVDGDTLDLRIDLGFDVQIVSRIRLMAEGGLPDGEPASVDAWETRGSEREKGLVAKGRTETLCPFGSTVRVFSAKGGSRGKYGRWLAVVLYRDGDVWRSLGDTLLAEGLADDPGY